MGRVPIDPGETRGGNRGAKKPTGPRRRPAAEAGHAAPETPPATAKQRSNQQALADARRPVASGPAKIVASLVDPFGFRKFEEVFDQRVACALDRIGLPAPDMLISLIEQIEALRRRVEQLEKVRC